MVASMDFSSGSLCREMSLGSRGHVARLYRRGGGGGCDSHYCFLILSFGHLGNVLKNQQTHGQSLVVVVSFFNI